MRRCFVLAGIEVTIDKLA